MQPANLPEITLTPLGTLGDCLARRQINTIFSKQNNWDVDVLEIELRALSDDNPTWKDSEAVVSYLKEMIDSLIHFMETEKERTKPKFKGGV